jgi:hypothetical protein
VRASTNPSRSRAGLRIRPPALSGALTSEEFEAKKPSLTVESWPLRAILGRLRRRVKAVVSGRARGSGLRKERPRTAAAARLSVASW